MAWQFTENAVQTVIHTAENIYNLVITDVEDAVTAVVGFLKTVVADIIKVIQWLSALFNWENILRNHTYIKNAITNPGDPANPGMIDRLAAWVASELNGGTDTTTVLGPAGQPVRRRGPQHRRGHGGADRAGAASGNNDPNQVYNTGGNNNANQCTWMHQRSARTPARPRSAAVRRRTRGVLRPGTINAAFEQFLTALETALTGSFADFPGRSSRRSPRCRTTSPTPDPR